MRAALNIALLAVLLPVPGCDSKTSGLPDTWQPRLDVEHTEPGEILVGTGIHVFGEGFEEPGPEVLSVSLRGPNGEREVDREIVDDTELVIPVDADLHAWLGGSGSFAGAVLVSALYDNGRGKTVGLSVDWVLQSTLTPTITQWSAADALIYLGTEVEAVGQGYLQSGEGKTELRLAGSLLVDGAAQPQDLEVSCTLPHESRTVLRGPFPADCLGIAPGTFEGAVTPVNVHAGGDEVEGTVLGGISIAVGPTVVLRVEPTAASRGQPITITGRGFVGHPALTTIRLDGSFTDSLGGVIDLTGPNALELVPEVVSGEALRYVLRVVSDGQGGVTGLGAVAGELRATATPMVYHASDTQEGLPLGQELVFTVLPQKQVVFVSFLPGFTDALRDFGLRNVEHLVRDRIMTVLARDYQEVNVEFVSVRPTEYTEYSVIEVGGADPNGRGLIGLDNTMGKDTGNLNFDDVVGGFNAESREDGNYAFGGVFVASYLAFSPKASDALPMASTRFDEIFEGFMESRGGQVVDNMEYPNGVRAEAIGLAVHALGSMIGNTISHEIGHTLGLASGPAELFHNPVPAPDQIMDAGIDRPFEERAEVDDKGPAVFGYENIAYLRNILPK